MAEDGSTETSSEVPVMPVEAPGDVAGTEVPRCRFCGSEDIRAHEVNRGSVYYVHVECLDCGQWEMDEEGGI